jgi:hypothetical protein
VGVSAPVVTWTNPAPLIYGSALGSNQLNAVANVAGSFAFAPANGIILNTGAYTLSAIFTPADQVNYSSQTNTVNLIVLPAALTVTAANASRTYNTANPSFTGTVTGLTNGDSITANYACAATSSSAPGTYSIVPSLVDPNNLASNYTVNLVNGALTVSQASGVITWTNPAPIVYGAALDTNQLNATANEPGSFAYDPPSGSVPNAGTNTLTVIFTPANPADYGSATNAVNLVVSPATLTVTAADASRLTNTANPVFTGTIVGLTNGDEITVSYSCSATNDSPPAPYPIVPSLVDPSQRQTNYTVNLINGTLMVAPILFGHGGSSLPSSGGSSNSESIWGVPPFLTMTVTNGRPGMNIGGTVGASLMVQTMTNAFALDGWQTMTNITLTNIASLAQSNQTPAGQDLLDLAFVPAAQEFPLAPSNSSPFQLFRVIMPYDYAILASIVLRGDGYTPRLIVVNMPGIVSDDGCYVNEAKSFICYDRTNATVQLQASGPTIRQIAKTLANSLDLDWTSASEFSYSNGLGRILATVVQTEPASSDPVAGQNPPSQPMVIDF